MVNWMHPPITPLFVPASRPHLFAKVAASGADAVILDLEDAVAPGQKAAARAAILSHAASLDVPVIVRINAIGKPWHEADLDALRPLNLLSLMLPKTESAQDISSVHARFGRQCPVIALVETAAGLGRLADILAAPNLAMIAFGSVDFALDIGCAHDRQALLAARSEIVWRSRAANCRPPLDGVTLNLGASDIVAADAAHAAMLGFGGKMAIHPAQIDPIRGAFTPSDAAIAWAHKILAAGSSGEATRIDGEMVDRPIVERAHRILASPPKIRLAPRG